MPISLRCPGCGKVYRVPDDRAGKRAQCPCGAVMKVPASGASQDGRAWEDEVNRVFGPSAASDPQDKQPQPGQSALPDPPKKAAATTPVPAEPRAGAAAAPPGQKRTGDARLPPLARLARFFKIDLRGLVKKDPWRAVVGLAAVAYGAVAAPVILSGVRFSSLGDVLFGDTTWSLAEGALAVAMAFGGMLILKRDKRGPGCAGLAAALFCVVPLWGVLPGIYRALETQEILPLLWLVPRYGVPIALTVWCIKEETRREGKKDG